MWFILFKVAEAVKTMYHGVVVVVKNLYEDTEGMDCTGLLFDVMTIYIKHQMNIKNKKEPDMDFGEEDVEILHEIKPNIS